MDIKKLLKKHFGELDSEKIDEFLKEFRPEYKSKEELKKATDETDEFKKMYEVAKGKLEELEKVDPEKLKAEVEKLQAELSDNETAYNEKLKGMEEDRALEAAVSALKFTSEYAKVGFMNELKKAGLKVIDGVVLGFNDYVELAKKKDPGLFEAEGKPRPKFTEDKTPPGGEGRKKTKIKLSELSRLKNENPDIDLNDYEFE